MINSAAVIGSGNVATHISSALKKSGIRVEYVCSEHIDNAIKLAEKVGAVAVNDIKEIDKSKTDIFLFAVTDRALTSITKNIDTSGVICMHTSGGVGMDVFESCSKNFGVLYPLQTFTKERELCFCNVPLLIEGNNPETLTEIKTLALKLSHTVIEASSEQRKHTHIAAVFACNFVNNMYDIAAGALKESNLPFSILEPLIKETAAKIESITPRMAQTGPAVRYDIGVIETHLSMIKDKEIKEIYTIISKNIYKFHTQDSNDTK